MANTPLGVGIIGLQAGRSWASSAHLPALNALAADFRVVGIANTTLASAQAAVAATGAGRAFASVADLVAAPDVAVVAVTVKVPQHRAPVIAALEAGKHVFCEWPLGNGLTEARELAALARKKGVHTVVGTQARVSPALRYVKYLIADGYIGEVLSATLVGSGMAWGALAYPTSIYLFDNANGASLLTIPFGHALAASADILGPVAAVSAELIIRRKTVRVVETGEDIPVTAPDQVLVAATLESGAPLSIHYRGGTPRGTGLLWEINGSDGDIQICGASGHVQMIDLTVKGGRGDAGTLSDLPIPEKYLQLPKSDAKRPAAIPAQNVAILYAMLAADLRDGTHTAPSFDDAVKTHQLIAAIEKSARDGKRVSVGSL